MAPNAITISFQKKPHSMPMLLSQRGQDQEALFLKVKQHVFLKASLKKTGEMKDKHHKNTPDKLEKNLYSSVKNTLPGFSSLLEKHTAYFKKSKIFSMFF